MPPVSQASSPHCNPVLASELLGSHSVLLDGALPAPGTCDTHINEKLEICDRTADLKVTI